MSRSPGWSRGLFDPPSAFCSTRPTPTIETGAASIDGRQYVPAFSGIRDEADADATDDCPWCDALREAGRPPTDQPSRPAGRRHDPYVSGAQYDDW
ncbi:hypothetical protein [Streptomyces sp. NPDC054940]